MDDREGNWSIRPWRAGRRWKNSQLETWLDRAQIAIWTRGWLGCALRKAAAANHLAIAAGSHGELETQIELAHVCTLLSPDGYASLSAQCALTGRLLSGLLRSARALYNAR